MQQLSKEIREPILSEVRNGLQRIGGQPSDPLPHHSTIFRSPLSVATRDVCIKSFETGVVQNQRCSRSCPFNAWCDASRCGCVFADDRTTPCRGISTFRCCLFREFERPAVCFVYVDQMSLSQSRERPFGPWWVQGTVVALDTNHVRPPEALDCGGAPRAKDHPARHVPWGGAPPPRLCWFPAQIRRIPNLRNVEKCVPTTVFAHNLDQ